MRHTFATQLVDTLLAEFDGWDTSQLGDIRARWVATTLTKLNELDFLFPKSKARDPELIQCFMDLHPGLEQFQAACTERALILWPQARFEHTLLRDPEGCALCGGGTSLVFEVCLPEPEGAEVEIQEGEFYQWWLTQPGVDEISDCFSVFVRYSDGPDEASEDP